MVGRIVYTTRNPRRAGKIMCQAPHVAIPSVVGPIEVRAVRVVWTDGSIEDVAVSSLRDLEFLVDETARKLEAHRGRLAAARRL